MNSEVERLKEENRDYEEQINKLEQQLAEASQQDTQTDMEVHNDLLNRYRKILVEIPAGCYSRKNTVRTTENADYTHANRTGRKYCSNGSRNGL